MQFHYYLIIRPSHINSSSQSNPSRSTPHHNQTLADQLLITIKPQQINSSSQSTHLQIHTNASRMHNKHTNAATK